MSRSKDEENCCGCCSVRVWIFILSGAFAILLVATIIYLVSLSITQCSTSENVYTYSSPSINNNNNRTPYYPGSYYICPNEIIYYSVGSIAIFFLLVLIWLWVSTCSRSRVGYIVFIAFASIFLLIELAGLTTVLIMWLISIFRSVTSIDSLINYFEASWKALVPTACVALIFFVWLSLLLWVTCRAYRAETRRQTNKLIKEFNQLFSKP